MVLPTNLLHRGHVLIDHFMNSTQISRHEVSTKVGGEDLQVVGASFVASMSSVRKPKMQVERKTHALLLIYVP